jgi:hypothetical protein
MEDDVRPLWSSEIKQAIAKLTQNCCRVRDEGDLRIIEMYPTKGGFPLSDQQKETLERLRKRFVVANAYEAEKDHLHRQFGVDRFEKEMNKLGDAALRIARQIVRAPANNLAELK